MKKIAIEVCKIADKKPENGQECWVMSKNKCYPGVQVYNNYYDCWDTADGDDFDVEVCNDDIWMPLPKRAEMEE